MGRSITLTGDEPLVRDIARAAYPSYKGRKFELHTTDTVDVRSSWEGGSRSYFVFVELGTMRASSEMPAQSAFDRPLVGADSVKLPDGVACVEHIIFRGKDLGIAIHVNHATMNPVLLPAPVQQDLDDDERKVLVTTSAYKSFARLQESGLTQARWDAAKTKLIGRGLLNKAGAITVAGRNAANALRGR